MSEDSFFLHNIKYVLSIWCRNPTSKYSAKNVENMSAQKLHMIFRVAYFIKVNSEGTKIFFSIQTSPQFMVGF